MTHPYISFIHIYNITFNKNKIFPLKKQKNPKKPTPEKYPK